MQLPDVDQFQQLVEQDGDLSVSIFMPTERAGRQTRQNPIRFKNALAQVQARLVEGGMREPDAEEYLAPLAALQDDNPFWQNQLDGLAVFFHDGEVQTYPLPVEVANTVMVADHYYIEPLVELFVENERFFMLLLSKGGVQLLACSRYNFNLLDFPEGVPTSLAEAMRFEDPQRQLQFHSGTSPRQGDREAMYFGHEASQEEQKNLKRFLQQIDKVLNQMIAGENAPLILVGTDDMRGAYQQVSAYAQLYQSHVDIHPGQYEVEELHEKAWQLFQPLVEDFLERQIGQYHSLAADDKIAGQLDAVLNAAVHGRVDRLFLPQGKQEWGRYDQDEDALQRRSAEQPGSYELLNFAALHTLRNGGSVLVCDPEEFPAQEGLAAAILRY